MAGTYILLGPEKGLREDFISKVKSSLGPCAVSKYYAFEDYEEQMYADLGNNDLFSDHKLVILEEAQSLTSKEKTKPIVEFIKNPSDCATLILVSNELYINQDIMAAIPDPQNRIQKFYELFENKKEEYLRDFFRRNGMSITSEACQAIIEKVENNISEFQTVCGQLVTYLKTLENKNEVAYDDVEDFLSHTRQETEFTLFSYLAKRRLESALECLSALLHTSDDYQVSSLIAVRLAAFFRRALSLRTLTDSGMSFQDACRKPFFAGEREIRMPKEKDIYKDCISNYSARDIERILVTLAEYDIKIKDAGTSMQQTMIERCLVDIIIHRGTHTKKPVFATI